MQTNLELVPWTVKINYDINNLRKGKKYELLYQFLFREQDLKEKGKLITQKPMGTDFGKNRLWGTWKQT